MRILVGPLGAGSGTYDVSAGGANPGVGGTDHVAIQLALRLGEKQGHRVVVATKSSEVVLKNDGRFLEVLNVSGDCQRQQFDLAISPVATLPELLRASPSLAISRQIAWSHHPHDAGLTKLCRNNQIDAVVSVGGYQFYSNDSDGAPHHWIPNPFPYWAERRDPPMIHSRPKKVGFVGALVKAKGFHHVAKYWSVAHSMHPDFELEVIGSGALYGPLHNADSLIPADKHYAGIIRDSFPGKQVPQSVKFFGLLRGSQRESMSSWRYGIQNLTGRSEAMPASVQELIAQGIPVIGSMNFGMWDFMGDFPELAVTSPSQYPIKLGLLEGSSDFADEMLERCGFVTKKWKRFDEDDFLDAWNKVILTAVSSSDTRGDLSGKPTAPPLPVQDPRFTQRLRFSKRVEPWRGKLRALRVSSRAILGNVRSKR